MLGDSGGRSARHPVGDRARRRATQRERAHIDPPWDEVVPRWRLTSRGEKVRLVAGYVGCFIFGMSGGLLIAEWWGFR